LPGVSYAGVSYEKGGFAAFFYALRQTLASQVCCSRGKPAGR
jgi:hypothetical protein